MCECTNENEFRKLNKCVHKMTIVFCLHCDESYNEEYTVQFFPLFFPLTAAISFSVKLFFISMAFFCLFIHVKGNCHCLAHRDSITSNINGIFLSTFQVVTICVSVCFFFSFQFLLDNFFRL